MTLVVVDVSAREILDSRGRPTVEASVGLSDGTRARASVPAGVSRGRHEAVELRDGDRSRYGGDGVRGAVHNVEAVIRPELVGLDPLDQDAIDATLIRLDGTADKSRLGSNAVLAVSLAVARAASAALGLPLWQSLGEGEAHVLPLPMVNIVSGGLHARGNVDFQDYLVIPVGATSFSEALEQVVSVYRATHDLLVERGLSTLKADEGGFGPALAGNDSALDLLEAAIARAGYVPGGDVALAIDVAATHVYDPEKGLYRLLAAGRTCTARELVELFSAWVDRYPIVSIEDGLAEDDWEGWQLLTRELGSTVQLVGDDLFTTNVERLERGIALGAGNAVLVKMNQIGTLTETLDVVGRARAAGFRPVVSGRSGETEDDALADLAVATNAGQIKIGSVAQSERLAKYNQLLRIEEELGPRGVFAGRSALGLEQAEAVP
jgi:enolase